MTKRIVSAAACALVALPGTGVCRGVTPYLPLNLEPEIEAQIERVLILAGKPVMRRPIAAATVLEALPKACAVDARLCDQVGRYLSRYMHKSDLTHASVEVASAHGADDPLPNRYGEPNRSEWDASVAGLLAAERLPAGQRRRRRLRRAGELHRLVSSASGSARRSSILVTSRTGFRR